MRPLASLRGRLVLSTFAVCIMGVLSSDWLDAPAYSLSSRAQLPPWLRLLETEPYQDAIVLGAFTAVLLALLWAVTNWSLQPLRRASAELKEAGPAYPNARISAENLPTEIRPFAEAMNGALDRLAEAYAAERRFTANAAHELRTPLAVLDLRLRRIRNGDESDWTEVEQDFAVLSRRISQLLDLAKLDRDLPDAETVNFARAAREAAAELLPLIEAAGRQIVVEVPETVLVAGRHADLVRMIGNLLENALRHGAGPITVLLRVHDRVAVLTVTDKGAGVPPPEQDLVFERFRTRPGGGAGLGLAIVREVVRAHSGQVAFTDGPGCAIEVRLPLKERTGGNV